MSDDTTIGRGRWVCIARGAAVLGAGLISFGAWQAWPPAGPIVLGSILLVVGLGALRA